MVLWAEPAGENSEAMTEITRDNRFGEPIFSKVQRFVVIRQSNGYCSAVYVVCFGVF